MFKKELASYCGRPKKPRPCLLDMLAQSQDWVDNGFSVSYFSSVLFLWYSRVEPHARQVLLLSYNPMPLNFADQFLLCSPG